MLDVFAGLGMDIFRERFGRLWFQKEVRIIEVPIDDFPLVVEDIWNPVVLEIGSMDQDSIATVDTLESGMLVPKRKQTKLSLTLDEWLRWRRANSLALIGGNSSVIYWLDLLKLWYVRKLKPRIVFGGSLSIVRRIINTDVVTGLGIVNRSCVECFWEMVMLVGIWASTSLLMKTLKCKSSTSGRNLVWVLTLFVHVLRHFLGCCCTNWLCFVEALVFSLGYERRSGLKKWRAFFKEKVGDLAICWFVLFARVGLRVVKFLKGIVFVASSKLVLCSNSSLVVLCSSILFLGLVEDRKDIFACGLVGLLGVFVDSNLIGRVDQGINRVIGPVLAFDFYSSNLDLLKQRQDMK
jgi:hypothetical protein